MTKLADAEDTDQFSLGEFLFYDCAQSRISNLTISQLDDGIIELGVSTGKGEVGGSGRWTTLELSQDVPKILGNEHFVVEKIL